MIEIPLNKALVAVEVDEEATCDKCEFFVPQYNGWGHYVNHKCIGQDFDCCSKHRKDGKSVIFKLVDFPEENTNG